MKPFTVLAALLMTTSFAYAGNNSISFEINGHKVRIESPKNCDQLSCLKVSGIDLNGFNSRSRDDDVSAKANTLPETPSPAPVAQSKAPLAPAVDSAAQAAATPTSTGAAIKEAAAAPAPAQAAPAPAPTASPAIVAPAPTTVAAAPVQPPTTPIGVWNTEDNKGQVRIEACGPNLCGYAVKTGENVLINMKSAATKWIGTIHDPDSGSNYDSTIAMKGANSLVVRGCAFGGLFCGGQVWTRVS